MARVEHHDVAEPVLYQVGDAPGAGIYRCAEFPSFIVVLDADDDTLPDYPSDPCDEPVEVTYRRVVRHRGPHWLRAHQSRSDSNEMVLQN